MKAKAGVPQLCGEGEGEEGKGKPNGENSPNPGAPSDAARLGCMSELSPVVVES